MRFFNFSKVIWPTLCISWIKILKYEKISKSKRSRFLEHSTVKIVIFSKMNKILWKCTYVDYGRQSLSWQEACIADLEAAKFVFCNLRQRPLKEPRTPMTSLKDWFLGPRWWNPEASVQFWVVSGQLLHFRSIAADWKWAWRGFEPGAIAVLWYYCFRQMFQSLDHSNHRHHSPDRTKQKKRIRKFYK